MEPEILFPEILLFGSLKITAKISRSKRRRLLKKKAKALVQALGIESAVGSHPTIDGSDERAVMPAALGDDIEVVLERKTEISMRMPATSPEQLVSLQVAASLDHEAAALAEVHHPSLNANPTDNRGGAHSLAIAAQAIIDEPLIVKKRKPVSFSDQVKVHRHYDLRRRLKK